MDYPWIIHGIPMDYPWIIHRLSTDYPYTILKVDGSALFQSARIDGAVLPQLTPPKGATVHRPYFLGSRHLSYDMFRGCAIYAPNHLRSIFLSPRSLNSIGFGWVCMSFNGNIAPTPAVFWWIHCRCSHVNSFL